MSDSDFGGFTATTPVASRKIPPSTTTVSSRAANKRKEENAPLFVHSDDDDIEEVSRWRGNRGASDIRTGKRTRKTDNDSEEVEKAENEEDNRFDEEVQELPPPINVKKPRRSSRKPTSRSGKSEPTTNGNARRLGGKGKTKANGVAHMDVDEVGSLDLDEEDVQMEVEAIASHINASLLSAKPPKSRVSRIAEKGTDDECAKLREQLRQAQGHIEDLKRQLDEVHQVRKTEPEVLLHRMEAQHQKQQQANEALVKDLTGQLDRKDPVFRMNTNSAFELLTREEANKETQALRDQLKASQDAIRQRDQIVEDKDEEIGRLKTLVNDLRYELQAEIERTKSLSSQRQPKIAARARRGRVLSPNEDPKMAEVVRFYEDLTDLLVTDIKPQPARYLQLDDWLLTCLYTYQDVVGKGSSPAKSLAFKLRLCYEAKPDLQGEPKSKDDLADSLQYTPLDLDKEKEDFVKSLGFLSNAFTFERDQLTLFLRTLHDVVSGGDSEGSDDGIQVIG